MKTSSLSLRLLFAAGLSTIVALVITAVAISYLFEIYFQKRLMSELRSDLTQLTAAVSIQEDGTLQVGELADHRFDQPFGGRYWQISYGDNPVILSRSLWDQQLDLTAPETFGEMSSGFITAPFGAELLTMSWRIAIEGVDAPGGVVLSVATDLAELNEASGQFQRNIAFWLMLLGGALVLAAWLQVRVGLRPLEQIRADLERVSDEPDARLPTDYPAEVRPLVETINSQLERQSETLAGARRRASDLAHGLKTPLTVLAAHAEDLRAQGDTEHADQINRQVSSMRFFVERELARSRVSPTRNASSDLKAVATQMVDAIRKLPGSDALTWSVNVPEGMTAPFDAHDLSELLGNLLDNARKHARSRVDLSATRKDGEVQLRISDDGPGVSEDKLGKITAPGVQGAEGQDGQGLGLAIVQDMLDVHNGTLGFENHPGKGLTVVVTWQEQDQKARRENE